MEPISPPGKAPATQYAPSTPTDWSPPPKNVAEALDQLAEVQNTPVPAGEVPYAPAVPGDWSPAPTEVAQALDQLAAQAQGEVTAVTASAPLASSGGPNPNITISPATDAAPGSMSAADKTKLDNLAAPTVPFTPTTPSNWSPVPDNTGAALDQLAARPQGGNGGAEILFTGASPPPTITLSLTKQVSILVNDSGSLYNAFILPDGTDGMVKEIVNGINGYTTNPGSAGPFIASSPCTILMTDSLTNDAYDLPTSGMSVRLVWLTAAGGWVATNFSTNANQGWD
jgi:hypothetical protein